MGRKTKRCVFYVALMQLACCFALLVIAYIEDRLWALSVFFQSSRYGAALQPLMWLVCAPGFTMGIMSLVFLKYWASLVTNRALFLNILRIYIVAQCVEIFSIVWCIAVLFLTFQPVKDWSASVNVAAIFPYYVSTCIFIIPYLLVLVYYVMDISYYVSRLSMDETGVIEEPDPPADVVDLSDVSLSQVCMCLAALPCVMMVQLCDLASAVCRACGRYAEVRRRQVADRCASWTAPRPEPVRKRSSVLSRCCRTIRRVSSTYCGRCCGGGGGGGGGGGKYNSRTSPGDDDGQGGFTTEEQQNQMEEGSLASSLDLKVQVKDRELEQRLARERAEEEEIRRFERKRAEERVREEQERARLRRLEEQEAIREEEELRAQQERDREASAPTLSVPAFKGLWSQMATSGSFTCRLRKQPALGAFTDHLRAQGFYVVFASTPTPEEVELGICNIRERGDEDWFMARFLASKKSLSAVMKCRSEQVTAMYVKKFALAKVLKIDMSVGGGSGGGGGNG